MAIAWQTPYGVLNTTGTGPTGLYPTYAAGTVAGDVTLIVVGQKPTVANGGTLTTPNGFNIIGSITGATDGNTGGYGTTLGADTGNMNLYVLAEVATTSKSGTIDLVMTQTSSAYCYVARLSNATGLWNFAAVTGKDTTAGNVSVTFGSNPGVTAGDFLLAAFAIPTDVTTPSQFSAQTLTQTGVTFSAITEVLEFDNAGGNDCGGFMVTATANSGTASAAPVLAATAGGTTTNVCGPAIFVRLREVAGDTTAPTLTSPTATTTGATTASGTVSTNEANGTLYYLATTNATESVATVKAGSSQAVSAIGVQNVNFTGLTGSATYYAHYVHTDAANNDSARVSSASFTTNDGTAPTLTSPTATTTGATTASGTVSTNEANGTLYYLATTNATESVATVKAGSSQAVSSTGVQNVSFTGLTGSTTYYAHYVHTDAANNDSARVSSASFTTNDGTAPTLTSPTATTTGTTTASGTVSTNEANGTLYYLATTNATESVATVKAGSSQAVSATGVQNVSFTGLTGSTTYYGHYVHTDAANNDSTRVSSASFTTNGVQTYPVRYIRDRLNGSLGNGASYFVEIQAYDASSTNVALNKTVTANFTPGQGILSQLVNGNTSTDDYVVSFDANAVVTVDLGAEYQIASISRWHYYGDGRTFYDTKTETSLDGIVWVTIFDSNVSGTYAENSSGKNDLTVPPIVTLDNRQIGFIVPAYGNSSTQWSAYTDTADTAPTWSVFNPESGPGIVYNSTYNGYLTSYRAAGGKVLAYVSTSYAGTLNTTRTVSAVKEDIQIYMSWYGSNLDGFFLDELTSANNQTYLDYYREVMDYIKDINPHLFVVGNPGAAVDEVYANQRLADNLVIFENTAAVFQDYTPPAWINNYDRHMFSYLVYAATESQSNNVIDRARAENVQYVFITDDILNNPWDTAPTYWTAENTKAEGPDAPSIWQHPVDSIGSLGSSVTFSVSATGLATLTYQWYLDSGSGFNPISGAISSTYITPPITSGMNNYKYRVVVSNSEGSTVSFRANLTVTKPIKYWNGSTWITKPVKQWNGYRWATRASRYWNGSAWI